MTIDRRVARTHTALYEALLELILHKQYDRISVEDILRRADVGRSTFYAHFTSKDDLLTRSLERLRALLSAVLQDESGSPEDLSRSDPSKALFEHVAEFSDIQLALAGGRGAAIVRNAVDDVLADILRGAFPAQLADRLPRELAIRHIVSTFNTVLRWWLEYRPAMSPVEAHNLFTNLVLNGLPSDACRPFMAAAVSPETGIAAGQRTGFDAKG